MGLGLEISGIWEEEEKGQEGLGAQGRGHSQRGVRGWGGEGVLSAGPWPGRAARGVATTRTWARARLHWGSPNSQHYRVDANVFSHKSTNEETEARGVELPQGHAVGERGARRRGGHVPPGPCLASQGLPALPALTRGTGSSSLRHGPCQTVVTLPEAPPMPCSLSICPPICLSNRPSLCPAVGYPHVATGCPGRITASRSASPGWAAPHASSRRRSQKSVVSFNKTSREGNGRKHFLAGSTAIAPYSGGGRAGGWEHEYAFPLESGGNGERQPGAGSCQG